ncbi:hypothetical protein K505DRAFT_336660 [Melanomma pulvis-pyrius CBS 109.77]|uniref:BTB domain-containing protein n=1 Tax=Melanomma pulvis-pyrius CBS 109.77 TaxID=1314802 RepID=A0A6A6XE59_9PLEO|nr:hypothetical protein K505DRAFT_336660 [Melanomma pulvis-pyrius CBS 109.77]
MSAGQEDQPPRNIQEIFSQPTIVVKVGPNEEEFYIHKALVMKHSRYFRKELANDNFTKGKEGVVTLPDIEPWVFKIFIQWLYYQKLSPFEDWEDVYGFDTFYSPSLIVSMMYVFADRFLVPNLRDIMVNVAVEEVFSFSEPMEEAITYAFQNLPLNSTYLQLLVDSWCKHWTAYGMEDDDWSKLPVPGNFLRMVLQKYCLGRTVGQEKVVLNTSDYMEPKE